MFHRLRYEFYFAVIRTTFSMSPPVSPRFSKIIVKEYFDILIVSAQKMVSSDRIRRSFENNNRVRIRFAEFQLPSGLLFPLKSRFTLETYIRFWIGDFFREHERALYLDPDIIVTGSIAELWNTDLSGRAVGAVPIPGSTRPALIGMAPDAPYFNAGVMLFDLNAWRRRQYRDLCLRCLKENSRKSDRCRPGHSEPLPGQRLAASTIPLERDHPVLFAVA